MSCKKSLDKAGEITRDATKQNVAATYEGKPPDKTYIREWKKFFAFVDQKRKEKILQDGDKYVTIENVELFFATEVRKKIEKQEVEKRTM